MSTVLHLSDTHFGTERPVVVEALVALAVHQQPDLVILSGDITQRARPAQFRAARAFVERLGAPVLAIPGNHDIALFDLWSRIVRPYAGFCAAFGDDLAPVHAASDLLVIGVNTTRARRHRHGEVAPSQVEQVARLLATASERQLRMVVVHHPLAVPEVGERANRFRGHEAAARVWADAGADLVLGGHIHLPFVMLLPGLARPMWVVQAGTAVSTRTRPGVPNSVNLLHWGAAAAADDPARDDVWPPCRIERWDFCDTEQAFRPAWHTVVRPQRGSGQVPAGR